MTPVLASHVMKVCKHLILSGRVQGVWFRESMRVEAERLGVTGWVCNRSDGTVEAMVQGPPEVVEQIIQWAHRGPDAAFVAEVQVTEGFGEYHHFEKRRGE